MRGWLASACAAAIRSESGASPRVSLSGLPGVTSHQMRSRSSRRIASRQAARCAACGGSNVPPNRPILSPRGCGGRRMGPVVPQTRCAPSPLEGEGRAGGEFRVLPKEKKTPHPTRRDAARHPLPQGERVTPARVDRKQRRKSTWPDLPRAANAIFECGELLDADRPARVYASGGNSDLRAEAELAAIGELGRGIVQHDCGVDLAEEFLGGFRVSRDNRIGVM